MQRELCPHAISKDSFVDILNTMVIYGFIENANFYEITTLSKIEKERYSRNIDFFGHYAPFEKNKFSYQETLRKSKVILLGCGGLGSHILFELVAMGVGEIKIVDFDKIELANFNRQILFKEKDIGLIKTEAAQKIFKILTVALSSNLSTKKFHPKTISLLYPLGTI